MSSRKTKKSSLKFWKGKNVLVTGGTGFLGSEMVSQLVANKANVTVIIRDKLSKSRFFTEGMADKVNIVYGDLIDYKLIARTIAEYEIDIIFHLAAVTAVQIAHSSPLMMFESNIRGTYNVLEAAKVHKNRLEGIIVASTDKAYGITDVLPYDETLPLVGRYPYDVSKSCSDLIAQSYFWSFDLPVSITRCGNLFGPGDLAFSRIVPGVILAVMNNERPIIRSDGKFIRNYFYVKDAVTGYFAIAENMDKAVGEAFNLANEERYSVLEITDLILKLMNSNLKPLVKNEAKNEIYEQYLAVGKAKSKLGWKSSYTTEEGLKETIPWYEQHA